MRKGKIIFVDTSALFAIANAKDEDHQKAKEFLTESKAWQIIVHFHDKHFSYVDATSFAVMKRLGINDAFSFDEHFRQCSFNRLPD